MQVGYEILGNNLTSKECNKYIMISSNLIKCMAIAFNIPIEVVYKFSFIRYASRVPNSRQRSKLEN